MNRPNYDHEDDYYPDIGFILSKPVSEIDSLNLRYLPGNPHRTLSHRERSLNPLYRFIHESRREQVQRINQMHEVCVTSTSHLESAARLNSSQKENYTRVSQVYIRIYFLSLFLSTRFFKKTRKFFSKKGIKIYIFFLKKIYIFRVDLEAEYCPVF